MKTISADICSGRITCLVFEHYANGEVYVLEEASIARVDEDAIFTSRDEQQIRDEFPDLPPDTKLFVCAP